MSFERICLGRYYPKGGVQGVLSVAVDCPNEAGWVREAAGISDDDSVHLFRITSITGDAKRWLLPGDIVCQHDDIDEPMMDLVRSNATSVMALGGVSARLDQDIVERDRGEAISGDKWVYSRTATQLTIVDPYGRVAALVGRSSGFTRLFPGLSSIVPKTERENMRYSSLSSEKLVCGRFVLRAIHRAFIKSGPNVPVSVYLKYKRIASTLYDLRMECASLDPESKTIRIHFGSGMSRRRNSEAFIDVCKTVYKRGPEFLPRPLRLMSGKHFHVKWVLATPNEWEQVLLFWCDYHDTAWRKAIWLGLIKSSTKNAGQTYK
jgi:hypothetical protein